MKNKIILTIALLLMLLNFSSCYMRQVGVSRTSYYRPSHTFRHYGRERHTNVRRMYWGKHRSGMRPNRHRGQIRY